MIIGIAGGSGAGKTTVVRTIAERVGKRRLVYLSQDWYYKDHSHFTDEEIKKENLDHPEAFDSELLVEHLNILKAGGEIEVPIYDYPTHTRNATDSIHVSSKPVVLLEGILVLAIPEICKSLDLKIFVDAEPDIRLARRLKRDIKERGSSFDETIDRYLKTVKPMHDAFVEPSKRRADIIVPRGGQNEIATNLLVNLVDDYIGNQGDWITI